MELKTSTKHTSTSSGRLLANQNVDLVDYYLQLYEITYQLTYMGERKLAISATDRLDELFETMDSGERKALAIALQNLGT